MRKEDDVKQDIVDAQEKEESEQLEVKEKVVCKWRHLLVQKLKEKNEICEAKLKECQEENLQLKKLLAEKCKLEDKTEEEHIQEIQILNQKLNFQQSFYYQQVNKLNKKIIENKKHYKRCLKQQKQNFQQEISELKEKIFDKGIKDCQKLNELENSLKKNNQFIKDLQEGIKTSEDRNRTNIILNQSREQRERLRKKFDKQPQELEQLQQQQQ